MNQTSLTEVCTLEPRAMGCVGTCAVGLGSMTRTRSVLFCVPIAALTSTGPQRHPKSSSFFDNVLGNLSSNIRWHVEDEGCATTDGCKIVVPDV